MTFEEFFKKKKIALDALQQAEAALFSEFKAHYEQMGEKSFDHTKKYWFNKLRRRFPLPREVKAEKVHMENQIAEQTVTETLTEPTDVPKLGFRPKFKTAQSTKSVESTGEPLAATNEPPATPPQKDEEKPPSATENTAAKPAYKPRFQMKPKTATEQPAPGNEPESAPPAAEVKQDVPAAANQAPALGFKPRFKTPATAPGEAAAEPTGAAKPETTPTDDNEQAAPAKPGPPLGFKPRFKTTSPAPDNPIGENTSGESPIANEPAQATPPAENTDAKPAYKPRFNMKSIKPKPTGEE